MGIDKYTFLEKDWKLFRKMLPKWQERYMESLIKDYSAILYKDAAASEKFWEMEKRMRMDKKNSGVCIRGLRRSHMVEHIMLLLNDKVIEVNDLKGFIDSLKEQLKFFCQVNRYGIIEKDFI